MSWPKLCFFRYMVKAVHDQNLVSIESRYKLLTSWGKRIFLAVEVACCHYCKNCVSFHIIVGCAHFFKNFVHMDMRSALLSLCSKLIFCQYKKLNAFYKTAIVSILIIASFCQNCVGFNIKFRLPILCPELFFIR